VGQRGSLRESHARVGDADSTLRKVRVLSIPSQIFSYCRAKAGLPQPSATARWEQYRSSSVVFLNNPGPLADCNRAGTGSDNW
jgi:hypothetical protein